MKILMIIHTLGHGGAENTFRWLAWGLRKEGMDVIAAVPRANHVKKENWIAPALEELEVPYMSFDNSGSGWQLMKNISGIIDHTRPDIVHSHLLVSNFYCAIICKIRGVPHVCTEHGDILFKQTALAKLKYGLISLCSRFIICVSEAVKEAACRVIPFHPELKTIYNGIKFFKQGPSSFREECSIPEKAFLIGNVGNLYPIKGQRNLLRAFAEIISYCPDAYLVLVGRGAEENRLRQEAKELGLADKRVLFTGFRKDVENILNALDLYVQPSLSEGHPIAVLEAMSVGVPVIATAVGGVQEVIGANRFGMLVPPGSWKALYECIMEHIREPNVLCEKAKAARAHLEELFSIEKMVIKHINVYQDTLTDVRK